MITGFINFSNPAFYGRLSVLIGIGRFCFDDSRRSFPFLSRDFPSSSVTLMFIISPMLFIIFGHTYPLMLKAYLYPNINKRQLLKHYRLMAVEQHAVLRMVFERARQYQAFDIAANRG